MFCFLKYLYNPNDESNSNKQTNLNIELDKHKTYTNLFDNYIRSNKIIYDYELNNDLSLSEYKSNIGIIFDEDDKDNKINEDVIDIKYNFNQNKNDNDKIYNKVNNINKINDVNVEDVDSDDNDLDSDDNDSDSDSDDNEYKKIMEIQNKSRQLTEIYKQMQIFHLNIPYLNEDNEWIEGSKDLYQEYSGTNLKYLKSIYMDERPIKTGFDQTNKSNPNQIYRIISETCKSNLDPGTYNEKTKYFTSTTLINQDKIYDGLTNIELFVGFDNDNDNNNDYNHDQLKNNIIVENIQIRTRAKNKDELNSYRNIQWDLEYDLIPGGYRILGLDNFIHMSLVGLEEVFLDIIYKIEPNIQNNISNLEIELFKQIVKLEIKYTRCIYNQVIKTNLEKFLYENEENYFVDIIDYLVEFFINLDQEEKIYGNLYSTNYNVLRIMSGMGGIGYSN